MNIQGLKLYRKFSWVLALFSLTVISIVTTCKWLESYDFFPVLHIAVEWILLGILIIHCILSQKYLKLWWIRIFKGLKSKRARPIYILRLIQLITNNVILF